MRVSAARDARWGCGADGDRAATDLAGNTHGEAAAWVLRVR